jgi:hypothetical protein
MFTDIPESSSFASCDRVVESYVKGPLGSHEGQPLTSTREKEHELETRGLDPATVGPALSTSSGLRPAFAVDFFAANHRNYLHRDVNIPSISSDFRGV